MQQWKDGNKLYEKNMIKYYLKKAKILNWVESMIITWKINWYRKMLSGYIKEVGYFK